MSSRAVWHQLLQTTCHKKFNFWPPNISDYHSIFKNCFVNAKIRGSTSLHWEINHTSVSHSKGIQAVCRHPLLSKWSSYSYHIIAFGRLQFPDIVLSRINTAHCAHTKRKAYQWYRSSAKSIAINLWPRVAPLVTSLPPASWSIQEHTFLEPLFFEVQKPCIE